MFEHSFHIVAALLAVTAVAAAAAVKLRQPLIIEAVRPDVRELLGFDHRPLRPHASHALGRALMTAHHARPLRLDGTWVTSFSRSGEQPDIRTLGHQHQPGTSTTH